MIARVILLMKDTALRERLQDELSAEKDILVESVRSTRRFWKRISRDTGDLIVVEAGRIPDPALTTLSVLATLPDSPSVVVLMQRDVPDASAAYLEAGCEAALGQDLPPETILGVVTSLLTRRRHRLTEELERRSDPGQPRLSDFVSHSQAMQAFLHLVKRVIPTDVSLLLLGETGVGKERLARAIHKEGPRADQPFIAINCGALPEALLESELFGHEEGAFTGATRVRRGAFELAHGGTMFLDEVGEMPLHLQVKLLRVLQDHEIRRVGGESGFPVDVRVMAATNREIESEVEKKQFRQDLYYRLSVVTLTLPPLRERHEDIPDLVESYIHYLRPRVGRAVEGIETSALAALVQYPWPGNVRELVNVVERAMLLAETPRIRLGDLPLMIGQAVSLGALPRTGAAEETQAVEAFLDQPLKEASACVLDAFERSYLHATLTAAHGRVGEASAQAGITPRSLYAKMKRHGLRKEDYK